MNLFELYRSWVLRAEWRKCVPYFLIVQIIYFLALKIIEVTLSNLDWYSTETHAGGMGWRWEGGVAGSLAASLTSTDSVKPVLLFSLMH